MTEIIADTATKAARIRLLAAGVASFAIWLAVALWLPTSNRLDHVGIFLALFAGLFALYLIAVSAVRAVAGGRLLAVILGFAVVFRLAAILAGLPAERPLVHFAADLAGERVAYEPFLLYDNDLWRYLWDGHVLAEGENPYLVTPQRALDDDALAERLLATERWRDVHDGVSFRNYGTIYPPLVHYLFAGLAWLAPASAGAAKLVLAAIDLGLCFLLARILAAAGRGRQEVVVYAWNPAVIKEIAGSGHPDVLMMLLSTAGVFLILRGRAMAGAPLLAASVLAKLAPIVALPLVAVRATATRGPSFTVRTLVAGLGVGALLVWPLAQGLGEWRDALAVFAERWTFNSGPWAALRWLFERLDAANPTALTHAVTRVAIAATALGIAWRAGRTPRLPTDGGDLAGELRSVFRGLFTVLAALVLLSPAVMPWYVIWALPAAVVAGNRWWPAFTGLAFLSYLNYADGVGAAAWWKWIEYGGLAALVGFDLLRERRRTRKPVLESPHR